MKKMVSQSTPTVPPSEVSLTPKQKKYLLTGEPLKEEEKKISENGTLTSEEKESLDKKNFNRKKINECRVWVAERNGDRHQWGDPL